MFYRHGQKYFILFFKSSFLQNTIFSSRDRDRRGFTFASLLWNSASGPKPGWFISAIPPSCAVSIAHNDLLKLFRLCPWSFSSLVPLTVLSQPPCIHFELISFLRPISSFSPCLSRWSTGKCSSRAYLGKSWCFGMPLSICIKCVIVYRYTSIRGFTRRSAIYAGRA